MTQPWNGTVPKEPIGLDEALGQFPQLRQSLLARFDDCSLSSLFETRYSNGWSTHPQAAGTLFHRFAAEALRTMKATDNQEIAQEDALQILYEVVRQQDVPHHERVRASLRDLQLLRKAVIKWSTDNRFSVDRIVDIERRLYAPIRYDHPDGGFVERQLTGQLDLLLLDPPDGAIIVDWKLTWALPPEKRKDEPDYDPTIRLSDAGYFQQRFYGWLVLMNYPAVQRVTLREFYPLRTKARQATLHRADLEHVERELSILAEAFDQSVMGGTHRRVPIAESVEAPLLEVAGLGVEGDHWPVSPGKHCSYCLRPGLCPIEREARGEGAVSNERHAAQYAGEYVTADKIKTHRRSALKPWTAEHGPVSVRASKGRYMAGWRPKASGDGREFGIFPAWDGDRSPTDPHLVESMKASVEEARKDRDAARRERRRNRAA